MESVEPPYLLSPFVLAEIDYLLGTRVGAAAQQAVLGEVESGAFTLSTFTAQQIGQARRLMHRFADLGIGLTDASIAVIADAHGVRDLLTLDERHFRVVPGPSGKPFRILPADSGG